MAVAVDVAVAVAAASAIAIATAFHSIGRALILHTTKATQCQRKWRAILVLYRAMAGPAAPVIACSCQRREHAAARPCHAASYSSELPTVESQFRPWSLARQHDRVHST
ncbi:hypothetical protein J1614_010614 [Plenodomus biglobosus]|nr:hypothetical protein J1614_010614 [Plenodomus biglobosus]